MKKKTTRRSIKSTPPEPAALPPQLAGLMALMEEDISHEDAKEMARALAAARETYRRLFQDEECRPIAEYVASYVSEEAARGPWRTLHEQIDRLDRPKDSPFNATSGEFFNVNVGPAVTFALALAYVYLAEGGAR
jgi:hypothetical protein